MTISACCNASGRVTMLQRAVKDSFPIYADAVPGECLGRLSKRDQ